MHDIDYNIFLHIDCVIFIGVVIIVLNVCQGSSNHYSELMNNYTILQYSSTRVICKKYDL